MKWRCFILKVWVNSVFFYFGWFFIFRCTLRSVWLLTEANQFETIFCIKFIFERRKLNGSDFFASVITSVKKWFLSRSIFLCVRCICYCRFYAPFLNLQSRTNKQTHQRCGPKIPNSLRTDIRYDDSELGEQECCRTMIIFKMKIVILMLLLLICLPKGLLLYPNFPYFF